MGSGSQINGAAKLIGRRNYCDERTMVRRHWRPVWIRVTTPKRQTQTAPCFLIYTEKPLQPLGVLLPDPSSSSPLSFSPRLQRRSLSPRPWWPLRTHSEMSSPIWEQALCRTRSGGPSAGHSGTSGIIHSARKEVDFSFFICLTQMLNSKNLNYFDSCQK